MPLICLDPGYIKMSQTNTHDVIILGGGHNGLVCACYLAKVGLKVKILEKREVVGGAAVTEEFHPGFRNSVASYTVSLLHKKIIDDLHLHNHGLKIVLRPASNTFLLENNQSLMIHNKLEDTQREFSRFSQHDADQLPKYFSMLDKVANVIRQELLNAPPNLDGNLKEKFKAGIFAWRMKKLDQETRSFLIEMFTKSASEMLDSWFESNAIKAAFAFDAVVGNYASPSAPGSAYVLLHHIIGEANGVKGAWGHAMGGMGAITQAMLKEALSLGVEVETQAEVEEVLVKNNQAYALRLKNGDVIKSKCIAANVGPKLLFLKLLAPNAVNEDFLRRIRLYRCGSGTFRMNVALSELPNFSCLPGLEVQLHHKSGIIIGPSLDYLEQAWFDAKSCGWSKKPVIEMLIPSTVDPSLAPPGKHVASLFCQHFDPKLDWDSYKNEAADTIINTVNHFAPNFRASILGSQIFSPLDLERTFGLSGGDIFHGALSLDQLWINRPLHGFANYKTPIKNLFMCGSGTHPGGGVSGLPGLHAANAILKSL